MHRGRVGEEEEALERLDDVGERTPGAVVCPLELDCVFGVVACVHVGDELGDLFVVDRVGAVVFAVVLGDERGDGRLLGEAAPSQSPSSRDHRDVPGAVANDSRQRVGFSVAPLDGVGEQPFRRGGQRNVVRVRGELPGVWRPAHGASPVNDGGATTKVPSAFSSSPGESLRLRMSPPGWLK